MDFERCVVSDDPGGSVDGRSVDAPSRLRGVNNAHALTVAEVVSAEATDIERGLSSEEARSRAATVGRNEVAPLRAADPGVAPLRRAVQGRTRPPPVRRLPPSPSRLWVVRTRATRCPTKRSRSSPLWCSTPRWGSCRSRAPRSGRGAPSDDGRQGDRRARRTAPAHPRAEFVPGDILPVEEGDTIPADARQSTPPHCTRRRRRSPVRVFPVTKDPGVVGGRARRRRPVEHALHRHLGDLWPRTRS